MPHSRVTLRLQGRASDSGARRCPITPAFHRGDVRPHTHHERDGDESPHCPLFILIRPFVQHGYTRAFTRLPTKRRALCLRACCAMMLRSRALIAKIRCHFFCRPPLSYATMIFRAVCYTAPSYFHQMAPAMDGDGDARTDRDDVRSAQREV